MTNKDGCKGDGFSPLLFLAGFVETIAVVLFLALVVDLIGGSPADQVPVFEVIGFFVLFAWLVRRIDKGVQFAGDHLDKFLRSLTNAEPAGSPTYTSIEPKDLCRRHRYSFQIARGLFIAVALPALVIFAMYSLAEGSPVTATVWKWTYLCAVSLMAICLAWMIGTVFHARRWGCAKKRVNLWRPRCM